jgi:hypothetical protein
MMTESILTIIGNKNTTTKTKALNFKDTLNFIVFYGGFLDLALALSLVGATNTP